MTFKRYGYNFEKFDGEMTRSIGLRFWIFIYTFFAVILTLIYGSVEFSAMYIGLAFIYLLFSFLAEVAPKVKNYPVLVVFSIIIYFLYLNQGEMLQTSERVRTSKGWVINHNDGLEVMIIYCAYNILIALSALYGCLPKKNAYKSRQH